MRTVRALTSVGVMEQKTIPFGTQGPFEQNLPTKSTTVYSSISDKDQLQTKVFNFGHGSTTFPAGSGVDKTAELPLCPFLVAGYQQTVSNPGGDQSAAAQGAGVHQIIGKQIFARKTHLTIHLRYFVPKIPYLWKPLQGAPGTALPVVDDFKGSPAWYTPIQYRLLLVKFKRQNWPSTSRVAGGQMVGTMTAPVPSGAPILDATSNDYYPVGDDADETSVDVFQSAVNRALFIDCFGQVFGVGNTGAMANKEFDNYEAMSQPVCAKYFDVINEKKGWLNPPPVASNPMVLVENPADPTGPPISELGGTTYGWNGAALQTAMYQSIANPQASRKTSETLKWSLPWNDSFTMGKSNKPGTTNQPPQKLSFAADQAFAVPVDECLADVKLVMIFNRPAFDTHAQIIQNELPGLESTGNTKAAEAIFVPRVAITINGQSTFTDS